jgi:protocatechuate 3,4-dioxygenase beta subunit
MQAGEHPTRRSPARGTAVTSPVLPLLRRPAFEGRPLPHPDEPPYDQGLHFDVETLLTRRQVIRAMGLGAVAVSAAACLPGATPEATPSASPTATAGPTSGSTAGAGATTGADCQVIREETAGPFPADGSNGPDVLGQSGVVRQDIRSSFGSSTTVATGVPLTIRLAILDLATGCAPFGGAAVYAWHCDQGGRYSMYSTGVEGENYLRGVQAAGADGILTFQSVFPGCYAGRWPHVHFEVYPSLEAATDEANRIATSQIALPEDSCDQVYATSGYESSVAALASVSLARDGVFGEDGGVRQLGSITGSIADGLTVDLSVPVRSA